MRLFFVRAQSFGGILENLMCVDVTFVDETDQEASGVYEAIENACTKWVNETDQGREVWEGTSEDFNIGDLACEICPQLREYLLEEGISDIKFEQAHREQLFYYDQLLVGIVKEKA